LEKNEKDYPSLHYKNIKKHYKYTILTRGSTITLLFELLDIVAVLWGREGGREIMDDYSCVAHSHKI
jgi:hypothetical protein